jgi:hypothetical protein
MPKYTVYHGKFVCHTCKVEVTSLRLYPEIKEMTWMCKDKHLSKVNLGKRKKSDFDGEE